MNGLRIFAKHRFGNGPTRPVVTLPPPRVELVAPWRPDSHGLADGVEATILGALEASYGGPLGEAFRRKEAELAAIFSKLSSSEARVLARRLADPMPGDLIATRFARLVVDRRDRLLAVLDARSVP